MGTKDNKPGLLRIVIRHRTTIHAVNAVLLTGTILLIHISLLPIVIGGVVAGLFGGKCVRFCPMSALVIDKR